MGEDSTEGALGGVVAEVYDTFEIIVLYEIIAVFVTCGIYPFSAGVDL